LNGARYDYLGKIDFVDGKKTDPFWDSATRIMEEFAAIGEFEGSVFHCAIILSLCLALVSSYSTK